MGTIHWVGGAAAVAQVWTASIDSVDGTPANNTFSVTIGTVVISVAGVTSAAATAAALVALLNASTDIRVSGVTWSNPSGGDIVGTADVPGVPFSAALTETGAGTGTVTDFAVTTANAGPASAATPANYSGGAIPSASDTLVFKDSNINCCYDLEALSNEVEIIIHQTCTGLIGLKRNQFATSADGATATPGVEEYRPLHLKMPISNLEIGIHVGPGSPSGSARIKIHNSKAGASTTIIHDTNNSGESQTPAVHLKADHANADVFIKGCPGGVGLAVDKPGETATFGDIRVAAGAQDQLFIGDGATYTNLEGKSGVVLADAAATVTKVENNGADITLQGSYLVTTIETNGGQTYPNNVGAGNVSATTVNANAGEIDTTRSQRSRTFTTVNMGPDATIIYDSAHLTMTTFNQPTGLRELSSS